MTRPKLRDDQIAFRVRLECGHVVRARNEPWTEQAKFGCREGFGCGYRLAWTAYWSVNIPDHVTTNKSYYAQEKKEGEV